MDWAYINSMRLEYGGLPDGEPKSKYGPPLTMGIVLATFSAEDRAFKYCEMLNAEDGECLCGGEAADFSAYVYKECSVPPPRQWGMARINFGCREIEIVAAIGGLLKVLRDGGHRHVERAFITMPHALDELMRFTYQTPPLAEVEVGEYDKYHVVEPLQVSAAQDTAIYGAMMSSGPFNLLEQLCTHPQLRTALALLTRREGFAGSLVERLVEILTSPKKRTTSFQSLRERAAKIVAALVKVGGSGSGAGPGPALRRHARALAEPLKAYKADPAVADAMAILAGDGPISAEGGGAGSKVKACDMCGTEGKMRKCGKCKERRYCSVECQKADWPIHKKTCAAP